MILFRAQQSVQKCIDPSGFLEKSMGALLRGKEYHIAPASNNSSNYFLTSNYSQGLCLYMEFYTGLVLSTRGILCISPSFQFGVARVGNVPGNTSQYLHNTIYNDAQFFSSTFSKCGITTSGRSLSPYKISYRNSMGLPDVLNYFLYVMQEPLVVKLGNSYNISTTLFGRLFWICSICTESVT